MAIKQSRLNNLKARLSAFLIQLPSYEEFSQHYQSTSNLDEPPFVDAFDAPFTKKAQTKLNQLIAQYPEIKINNNRPFTEYRSPLEIIKWAQHCCHNDPANIKNHIQYRRLIQISNLAYQTINDQILYDRQDLYDYVHEYQSRSFDQYDLSNGMLNFITVDEISADILDLLRNLNRDHDYMID